MRSSRPKPRVLVATPDFPPAFGGIQRLMHRLVEHFERVDVRVVTLGGPDAANFDRSSPLDVKRAATLNGRPAIAALNARALVETIGYRPDVVLSGHVNVGPFALAARRLFRTPYVQYLYGREVVSRHRLSAAVVGGADAVIAISAHTQALAVAHDADPARVHLIPPGVDLPPSARHRAEPGQPTIVTVARLEERYKGFDVLLRALPLVRSRVPGARLVFVGDGPLRPVYERLARSIGVEADVDFTGTIGDAARDDLLARAQVFAMPSRLPRNRGGEGFGIVYLEASARGVPVVAGDVAGARDAVVHGETGLLVDPSDHVAVADALTTILRDPALAERLGQGGVEWAHRFSWPLIARQVEDVILDVSQ